MMSEERLTPAERDPLIELARQALELGVGGEPLPELDLESLPPRLQAPGASFVTLTKRGALRGCIGSLEPYRPLAEDVRQHAVAAALNDYRFPRLQPEELPEITLEISCLTLPQPLEYDRPEELPTLLRPHTDGVVLRDGSRRATFLPQVWEKLPDPAEFLNHLCRKMGLPPDSWRLRKLTVEIYQVEKIHQQG